MACCDVFCFSLSCHVFSCFLSPYRSLDKTVKMWEIETGDVIFSLDQMFSYVHSVCFDPSGEKIAVGSSNGVFILNSWSAEEDGPLFTLEGHEVR